MAVHAVANKTLPYLFIGRNHLHLNMIMMAIVMHTKASSRESLQS